MSIEIIGVFSHRDSSESHMRPMGEVDTDFIRTLTQAFERHGFDSILIAQAASWPEGLMFAAYIAAFTERLRFMIAHRPGFIAPTMAARMLATIDQVSHGRAGVHIISAPSDVETQADGDFLTRDERHRRSGEYIPLLRRIWKGETFDFEGDYFRFRGAHSTVRPVTDDALPVYFGGRSPLALEIAGAHADVYAFGIESLAESQILIEAVRAQALRHGRQPRFCMSTRIILGDTEDEAWARADRILEQVTRSVADLDRRGVAISALGKSERLEALAADGQVLDERLWIGIAKATRFQKASSTLVGTPQSVVDALLRYHKLGVTSFLISGYDPLPDIEEFGRSLIPLLRAQADAKA